MASHSEHDETWAIRTLALYSVYMSLPRALRGFVIVSAFFTLLSFGTEAVCRWVLRWGGIYSIPVSPARYDKTGPVVWFTDFHDFFDKFHYFHSRAFYTQSAVLPYPAPTVAAYKPFLIPLPTPHHGAWAIARFEGSMILLSLLLVILWYQALVKTGILKRMAALLVTVTYLCSFPFWFDVLQGNIEWLVWGLLSAALWAFCTSRFRTAAILIGIAGSMKIFPFIYVGLFLSVKRYRDTLLVLLAAVVSTLIGLWLVCPDVAYSWRQTILALTSFGHEYVVGVRPEVGFDHSLFALIKLMKAAHSPQGAATRPGPYLLVVAITGVLLFFLRIRHLPLPNQVLCLAISSVLLPPVSYDYTLLHLYAGLVLLTFVAIHRQDIQRRGLPQGPAFGLWAALLVLAFLLSPESELIWHGNRYAGQVKALALLALGYISLRYPFILPGLFEGSNSPSSQPISHSAPTYLSPT